MFSWAVVLIASAISLPPSTPMDDDIQMSSILSFPIALVLRDATNYLIEDSAIISCHGFRKFFDLLFGLSKSSVAYCSWLFSPTCIMVKSICLAAFIKILYDFPLILLTQPLCEWTQSSEDTYEFSFRLRRPFKQNWFPTNQFLLIVHLNLFNLLVFDRSIWLWYANLEIIIPLVIK